MSDIKQKEFTDQEEKIIEDINKILLGIKDYILIEQFYLLLDCICNLIQKLHSNIQCFHGCNLCCREYALVSIYEEEWKLLKLALDELDTSSKILIKNKVKNILNNNLSLKDGILDDNLEKYKNFECPLLINEKCSVYHYRPYKCRTHGYFYNDIIESPNNPNKDYIIYNMPYIDDNRLIDINKDINLNKFIFSTCSKELFRLKKQFSINNKRYMYIPLETSFKNSFKTLDIKEKKGKQFLVKYLIEYFIL